MSVPKGTRKQRRGRGTATSLVAALGFTLTACAVGEDPWAAGYEPIHGAACDLLGQPDIVGLIGELPGAIPHTQAWPAGTPWQCVWTLADSVTPSGEPVTMDDGGTVTVSIQRSAVGIETSAEQPQELAFDGGIFRYSEDLPAGSCHGFVLADDAPEDRYVVFAYTATDEAEAAEQSSCDRAPQAIATLVNNLGWGHGTPERPGKQEYQVPPGDPQTLTPNAETAIVPGGELGDQPENRVLSDEQCVAALESHIGTLFEKTTTTQVEVESSPSVDGNAECSWTFDDGTGAAGSGLVTRLQGEGTWESTPGRNVDEPPVEIPGGTITLHRAKVSDGTDYLCAAVTDLADGLRLEYVTSVNQQAQDSARTDGGGGGNLCVTAARYLPQIADTFS